MPTVTARVHVAGARLAAGPLELPPDEAHHLQHVLRARVGTLVRVFDGAGHEWDARVARIDRRAVLVDLVAPAAPRPEWGVDVVLAQAVLKGERMDEVVRDATMLGVAGVQPMTTAHDAVGGRAGSPRLRERWLRVAIASAKQCGRAVVPSIAAVLPFDAAIVARGDRVGLLLVEPAAVARLPHAGRDAVAVSSCGEAAAPRPGTGGPTLSLEELRTKARASGAHVLVGPEGGWAPGEVAGAVAAGYHPWTLGALTLRADVMALCVLSVLRYSWREALTDPPYA